MPFGLPLYRRSKSPGNTSAVDHAAKKTLLAVPSATSLPAVRRNIVQSAATDVLAVFSPSSNNARTCGMRPTMLSNG